MLYTIMIQVNFPLYFTHIWINGSHILGAVNFLCEIFPKQNWRLIHHYPSKMYIIFFHLLDIYIHIGKNVHIFKWTMKYAFTVVLVFQNV